MLPLAVCETYFHSFLSEKGLAKLPITNYQLPITNYLYGVGVGGKASVKNSSVGAGGRATVKPSTFLYVKYET